VLFVVVHFTSRLVHKLFSLNFYLNKKSYIGVYKVFKRIIMQIRREKVSLKN
jgi:hypothetical protein